MEEESLESLEAQIESAVSELSEDELAEEVDEETLLGIVNAADVEEEIEAGLDELDMLDADELKAALGEELGGLEAGEAPEEEVTEEACEEALVPESAKGVSPAEGIEALKTLMKALENEEVAKSLKGMNININISFGEKD